MRQRTYATVLAAATTRGGKYDTQKPWKATDTGGERDTARRPPNNMTGQPMTGIAENKQKERT